MNTQPGLEALSLLLTCIAIIGMIVGAIVYKVQIEAMNKRNRRK